MLVNVLPFAPFPAYISSFLLLLSVDLDVVRMCKRLYPIEMSVLVIFVTSLRSYGAVRDMSKFTLCQHDQATKTAASTTLKLPLLLLLGVVL